MLQSHQRDGIKISFLLNQKGMTMTLKECYTALCGNYDEALSRLMNERLMERFLQKFLSDPSFKEIKDAFDNKDG